MSILSPERKALSPENLIERAPEKQHRPQVLRDRHQVNEVAAELAQAEFVAVHLVVTQDDLEQGEIIGVGLGTGERTYYVPTAHRRPDSRRLLPDQLPVSAAIYALKFSELRLATHDAKRLTHWLRQHAGIRISAAWDTMLAARLLGDDEPDPSLKKLLGGQGQEPENDLQALPIQRGADHCVHITNAILELMRSQRECLD